MTKRLQVLLDDAELRTIQRLARRDKLSTAEWVRRRLREGAAAGARPDTATQARCDPRSLPTCVFGAGAGDRPDARRDRARVPSRWAGLVILVDSNIPMYLVGGPHPNKEAARRALEEAVAAGESLCSDAEVLQEILHRYTAVRRPEEIDPASTPCLRASTSSIRSSARMSSGPGGSCARLGPCQRVTPSMSR